MSCFTSCALCLLVTMGLIYYGVKFLWRNKETAMAGAGAYLEGGGITGAVQVVGATVIQNALAESDGKDDKPGLKIKAKNQYKVGDVDVVDHEAEIKRLADAQIAKATAKLEKMAADKQEVMIKQMRKQVEAEYYKRNKTRLDGKPWYKYYEVIRDEWSKNMKIAGAAAFALFLIIVIILCCCCCGCCCFAPEEQDPQVLMMQGQAPMMAPGMSMMGGQSMYGPQSGFQSGYSRTPGMSMMTGTRGMSRTGSRYSRTGSRTASRYSKTGTGTRTGSKSYVTMTGTKTGTSGYTKTGTSGYTKTGTSGYTKSGRTKTGTSGYTKTGTKSAFTKSGASSRKGSSRV